MEAVTRRGACVKRDDPSEMERPPNGEKAAKREYPDDVGGPKRGAYY